MTIDSNSAYVEDTDYYLYPNSSRAFWIDFVTAPITDKGNISITYNYGELDSLVDEYVRLYAAMAIVRQELAIKGEVGFYQPPSQDQVFPTDSKAFTLYKSLKSDVKEIEKDLNFTIGVEVIQ